MKYIFLVILAVLLGLFIVIILTPVIWIFYKVITFIVDKLDDWIGDWFDE